MSAITRAWLLGCLAVVSCSSSEDGGGPTPSNDGGEPPPPPVAEAGPSDGCSDCAFFPDACDDERFCPVDVGFDRRARVHDIRGTSESDVWAVGSLGTVLHYDGHAWLPSGLGTKDTLARIGFRPGGEIWATSSVASVYLRAAETPAGRPEWRRVTPSHSDPLTFGTVHGLASTSASTWVWLGTDAFEFNLVRMTTSGEEIVVDRSLGPIHRGFGRRVLGLHALSKDEIWGVGETGSGFRIRNADSDTPTVLAFNTQTLASLRAVWAVAADDVWAVGTSGTVRRHRGENRLWDIVDGVPSSTTLRALWAASSSDVWAVGDAATILHYDGTTWTRRAIATLGDRRPDLYGVWGDGRGHVWAGGDGVLLALQTGGAK